MKGHEAEAAREAAAQLDAQRQRMRDLAQAEADNYARNHKPVKPQTTKTGE